jgi:hypothetical protein
MASLRMSKRTQLRWQRVSAGTEGIGAPARLLRIGGLNFQDMRRAFGVAAF